jgi:hypothetical protein
MPYQWLHGVAIVVLAGCISAHPTSDIPSRISPTQGYSAAWDQVSEPDGVSGQAATKGL